MRDALTTVQTLQDRQQKMATTELGHRDVFGMKIGPAGAVVQVFQVRRGRVVERVELVTEASLAECWRACGARRRRERRARGGAAAVLRDQARAPGGARAARAAGPRGARDVALGARRPQGPARRAATGREARARSSWPCATPRSSTSSASTRGRQRSSTRSRRCARSCRCRRCRAASSASTSRPSRAARPWPRWSSATKDGCGRRSTGSSRSGAPASGSRLRARLRLQPGSRARRARRESTLEPSLRGRARGVIRGRESTLEAEVFSGRGWGPDRLE